MSFILDALKKSETDRQRQNGPALFEVRVAPPRNALPLWAVGLAVLLAVNLVIVAWVLLRRPATVEVAAAPPAAAQAAPPLQQMQMAPQQMAPQMVMQPTSPPAQAYQGAQQGQAMTPMGNTVPVSGTPPTAPVGQTAGMTQPPSGGGVPGAPAPAVDAQSMGGGAQSDEGTGEKLNPDDYAPAADPGPIQGFGNHVARNTASGVPLYQDAIVAPGANIPDLRLDLHVFAAKPQDRFVMINMKKLHEGDSLPNGVHVESITPEGAVLSHDGAKFLLPRQ
jgi:general secretion pathway protein B